MLKINRICVVVYMFDMGEQAASGINPHAQVERLAELAKTSNFGAADDLSCLAGFIYLSQ